MYFAGIFYPGMQAFFAGIFKAADFLYSNLLLFASFNLIILIKT